MTHCIQYQTGAKLHKNFLTILENFGFYLLSVLTSCEISHMDSHKLDRWSFVKNLLYEKMPIASLFPCPVPIANQRPWMTGQHNLRAKALLRKGHGTPPPASPFPSWETDDCHRFKAWNVPSKPLVQYRLLRACLHHAWSGMHVCPQGYVLMSFVDSLASSLLPCFCP